MPLGSAISSWLTVASTVGGLVAALASTGLLHAIRAEHLQRRKASMKLLLRRDDQHLTIDVGDPDDAALLARLTIEQIQAALVDRKGDTQDRG